MNTGRQVVERYYYDPYGRVTVLNGEAGADDPVDEWSEDADNTSDCDNEILYCGYRLDPETGSLDGTTGALTGFYHVRHRMYRAHLGWWVR